MPVFQNTKYKAYIQENQAYKWWAKIFGISFGRNIAQIHLQCEVGNPQWKGTAIFVKHNLDC